MFADLKVTTDTSDTSSHKGQPFRAFRIAHTGKHGAFIGRFTTAVDAAVAVARDVRDRGLSRRSLTTALEKGLKGEALLAALDQARARSEARMKARGGGEDEDEGEEEEEEGEWADAGGDDNEEGEEEEEGDEGDGGEEPL